MFSVKKIGIRTTTYHLLIELGLSQIIQETAMVNYECDMIMHR